MAERSIVQKAYRNMWVQTGVASNGQWGDAQVGASSRGRRPAQAWGPVQGTMGRAEVNAALQAADHAANPIIVVTGSIGLKGSSSGCGEEAYRAGGIQIYGGRQLYS